MSNFDVLALKISENCWNLENENIFILPYFCTNGNKNSEFCDDPYYFPVLGCE